SRVPSPSGSRTSRYSSGVGGIPSGDPQVDVGGRQQARAGDEVFEGEGAAVPVRATGVIADDGDQPLAKWLAVAAEARLDDGSGQTENPGLPRSVEDELAVAPRRGGGAVDVKLQRHRGAHNLATPIIESRVTSAASSSSVRPSVPGGRSGSTR